MSKQWGFTTKAIHGGRMPDAHKAVAPPIYQTATFYYDSAEEGARLGQEIPTRVDISRWGLLAQARGLFSRVIVEGRRLVDGRRDGLVRIRHPAAVDSFGGETPVLAHASFSSVTRES